MRKIRNMLTVTAMSTIMLVSTAFAGDGSGGGVIIDAILRAFGVIIDQ